MKRLWTVARIAGAGLVIAYAVVSWIEADREIRILCSTFEPDQPLHHVVATLDTGEYLRYRVYSQGAAQEVRVSSFYNGLDTACTVSLNQGYVTARAHRTRAQAYILFGK